MLNEKTRFVRHCKYSKTQFTCIISSCHHAQKVNPDVPLVMLARMQDASVYGASGVQLSFICELLLICPQSYVQSLTHSPKSRNLAILGRNKDCACSFLMYSNLCIS